MHNTQMIEEGTTTHTKRKNKRTRLSSSCVDPRYLCESVICVKPAHSWCTYTQAQTRHLTDWCWATPGRRRCYDSKWTK